MGDAHSPHAIVPVRCDTRATFKFMGNKIHTRFFVNFDCPLPYPGGAEGAPIDSIRPTPLEKSEEAIYNEHFAEEASTDTVAKKESKRRRKIAEKAWDAIDDYLLSEILFNPHTPRQLEGIRTELATLLDIVERKDTEAMHGYLKRVRKNIE